LTVRNLVEETTMWGVITLVQESRFQLLDESGVAHLLLLAHDVAVDARLLMRLAESRTRVRVTCRDTPHLIAHLATALEAAADMETERYEIHKA
jgi:hypothetical protein